MQNPDQVVNELDLVELRRIVSKMVSYTVKTIKWKYVPIQENNVNSNTVGVFRVTGIAETLNNEHLDWSLILKIIHWENLAGTPLENNYNSKPSDWNYWKREALVYSSEYLTEFDTSVMPVKCYEVIERVDGSIWLWLEDLQFLDNKKWSLDRLILAAHHFGVFGAYYLEKSPRSNIPWLCTSFLRPWIKGAIAVGVQESLLDPSTWKNEFIKKAFPVSIADPIMHLFEDSQKLLSILEKQQKTLCHNDCDQPNLFPCDEISGISRTIVIDWALLGIGALGEDIGTQIGGNLFHLFVDPSTSELYKDRAIEAYLCGLHESGWRGDKYSIHFACYTTASLRYITYGAYMLMILANMNGDRQSAFSRFNSKASLHETVCCWAEVMYKLLQWSDNARRLANLI
jgi:hypothetical protein